MSANDIVDDYSPKPIRKTQTFVKNNITQIYSVTQLAEMMGYSRCYFSSRVREIFDKTPAQIIHKKRFQKVKEEIQKHPRESSDAIARRAGFDGGNRRLYKFLSRHWNTTFTQLKEKLLPPPLRSLNIMKHPHF